MAGIRGKDLELTATAAEDQFKYALSLYEHARYEEARTVFQELAETFPHRSELWLNLGNVDFQLESLSSAESYWKKALDINPMEKKAYLNMGNLYFKQERYRRALEYWKQYRNIDPKNATVWLNLGLAYETIGDIDLAYDAYKRFLRLSPQNSETARLRKRFGVAQKVFENNIRVAERALSSGRLQDARNAYEKALPHFFGTFRSYKSYAALLYRLNEADKALENYLRAHRMNPKDSGILINIGVIHEKRQEYVDAIWAYNRALQFKPPDISKVQQRLNRLLQSHQKDFSHYFEKARREMGQGEFQEAQTRLSRLKDLSDYAPALQAQIKDALNELKEITQPVIRALKIYLSLAENAQEEGRFDQAMAYYNQFLELAPKDDPRAAHVLERKKAIQERIGGVISTLMAMDQPQDSQGVEDTPVESPPKNAALQS